MGALAGLMASGCGYTLQTSKGSTLADEGITRIYIAPIKNESFKPGIENLVYNELVQVVAAGRRVRLVEKPEFADAILDGSVAMAEYRPNSTTASGSIFPTNRNVISIAVATEYVASVSCGFTLTRTKAAPASLKKGKLTAKDLAAAENRIVWTASFSRDKRFPGNNQKAEFGTTSPLINESEFERALKEITRGMMKEVHESMLAMF